MYRRILGAAAVCGLWMNFNSSAEELQESAFIYNRGADIPAEFSKSSTYVVDHKTKTGFEIYGPRGMKANLKARGFQFRDLDKENFLLGKVAGGYPSYEDLTRNLQDIHERFPDFTELTSLGKTIEGRDLWMLQISKHAHDDTPLPEVKYISSMHGDEITGRELMMFLIRDLAEAYGQDADITKLIDNTRIFIMPSMNPDGSFHIQRWNGRNKDLNRNFPDFSVLGDSATSDGREPETQAIMAFQAKRHFALSANFHGGAEVVNYMWDTIPDDHPLLPLLDDISREYAKGVHYMRDSQEFPDGIVNGYAWYEVNGGMQDWSYYWHNDLQFTIELSGVKYPDYKLMDQYYRDNKASLIGFLTRVHQGTGFIVDRPGVTGTVDVYENWKGSRSRPIATHTFHDSYFYKVLSPGYYRFVIKSGVFPAKEIAVQVRADQVYLGGNFQRISL